MSGGRIAAWSMLGVLVLASPWIPGCKSSTQPVKGSTKKYQTPNAPARVLSNLEAAFELKSGAFADSVLDPAFVFRFQPSDFTPGRPDTLLRGEMLSCLYHLFVAGIPGSYPAPAASYIMLTLTTSTIADDTLPGHSGWKRISLQSALTLSFPSADELTINSPATFYCRQWPAGSGRWKLVEWKDQIDSAAHRHAPAEPLAAPAARATTWGHLFRMYE